MKTIGNYEARTHWSELLQEVKGGERYVILHKGEPIAELGPARTEDRQLRSKRAAEKLLQLMSVRPPVDADIQGLIDEGRD
ncbi:MAG: type II toxin-antitoxin system Phd/YefM family antitoxin [Herminiimonas sp.]|nr:type II toxin-antitoxin system Phd/YefM family antitoxin [Herminiimonas sp.]